MTGFRGLPGMEPDYVLFRRNTGSTVSIEGYARKTRDASLGGAGSSKEIRLPVALASAANARSHALQVEHV